MPREQMPQGNEATAPSGRNVQVTVTTMVECDTEYSLPVDESLPALPWRMEDKGDSHPQELTDEEKQIRIPEHQMKHYLDIQGMLQTTTA